MTLVRRVGYLNIQLTNKEFMNVNFYVTKQKAKHLK